MATAYCRPECINPDLTFFVKIRTLCCALDGWDGEMTRKARRVLRVPEKFADDRRVVVVDEEPIERPRRGGAAKFGLTLN